jgi:hypothetical protein
VPLESLISRASTEMPPTFSKVVVTESNDRPSSRLKAFEFCSRWRVHWILDRLNGLGFGGTVLGTNEPDERDAKQ